MRIRWWDDWTLGGALGRFVLAVDRHGWVHRVQIPSTGSLDTRTARSFTETQMPLEVARHAVGDGTLVRVRLTDRRNATRPVEDDFLFQHDVERAMYGGNTGALYRLYQR